MNMKKKSLILFLIFSTLEIFLFPENIDLRTLKEIEKATVIHKKMIKTGKGKVFHYMYSPKDYLKPVEQKGTWLFKDNHWRYDYEGDAPEYIKQYEGIKHDKVKRSTEIIDNILLMFETDLGCGAIVENELTGIEGLYFMGVTGIDFTNKGIQKYIEFVESEKAIFDSISDIDYEGRKCKLLKFTFLDDEKKVRANAKLIISPSQQYSYVYEETWTITKKNGNISKISMEYINPPGIWFPKEVNEKRFIDNPNTIESEDRYIFSDTQLNIPISDDELTVKIPSGSRITNLDYREIYHLDEEATLHKILSGKIKSDQEKDIIPLTERGIGKKLWRNIKQNVFLKLFIFIFLSFITFIIVKKLLKWGNKMG